jgi:diguanylate cyclase (GGDEF)-like protein
MGLIAKTADTIRVDSMRTRPLLYAATALAFFAGAMAQAQQYSFQYYGVDQGLTDLAVRSLFQDSRGFIWVSTENGIFRYDGSRFEQVGQAQGMPPSNAAMFGEAPDGRLLVGGSFGLYIQTANRFESMPMPHAKEVNWGAGIQSDGKGRTYIATDAGLMVVAKLANDPGGNPFQFRLVPAPAHAGDSAANGVLVDKDTVWWGCGDDLCVAANGRTQVLGLSSGLPPSAWRGIRKAGNGDLWVQSRSGRMAVMRHGETRFQTPDLPPSHFGPRGLVSIDAWGSVIVPVGDGLAIQQDGHWKRVGQAAGLHGPVYSVLQDREGSLWLGLSGHGLVRWLGYREWEYFNSGSGLESDLVYQVFPAPDGTLWAGTDSGLYRGRKSGETWSWRKEAGLGDIPVHSVRPDRQGRLWLGTESHGAARFDPRNGQVEWFDKRQGLTAPSPYVLLLDHQNRIWAGTLTGLFTADLKTLQFRAIPEVPAAMSVALIEGANGDIWAGTKQGLFQLSGGHWRRFTTADGLSHNEVLSLTVGDDGDIWVGYQFGPEMDRIRERGSELKFSHEGDPSHNSEGFTYFLGFDARKRLWVGTNRGVDVRDGGLWRHYDQHDGLVWDDCDLNGFTPMPDGTVWVGTSGGLAHFTPRDEIFWKDPPVAIFTQLTLGGKSAAQDTSVAYKANALAVRFSALSFARQDRLLFKYRLTPLFNDWRETRQRELQFPGLSPDSYRLEVEARDGWGRWSAEPASFNFEVRPPWWRSAWFISLLTAAALSVLVAVLRWRGTAARQRERRLVRLVDERTTELKEANGTLRETTLKLQEANQYLVRLSTIDGLTGIANRRMFDQTLETEWEEAKRTGTPLSVVLADIDHFKRLNDSAGHQAGDECLKTIARELARAVKRDTDLVARFGGEEFAVILPATDHAQAAALAESIRQAIEKLEIRHPNSPTGANVTISLGIATATDDRFPTANALVGAADSALYAAKQLGRNRAQSFDSTHAGSVGLDLTRISSAQPVLSAR